MLTNNTTHQAGLSRRQLLAGSIATGAGAIAGSTLIAKANANVNNQHQDTPDTQVKQPASGRTLRLAVMYGMIGDGTTVEEKFKVIKDCGFEGVEMDRPSDIPLDDVLAAAAKTGIVPHGVVNSVHWRFHMNAPSEVARTKAIDINNQAIRDAKALGATSILLVPAVVNARQSYDKAWELATACIRECQKVAVECNITIAVENVWNNFLLSPLEAARFVDQFGDRATSRVAWHFDIGNVVNLGFPNQWVDVLGKRIVKLHIKDFSRKKRDDEGLWKGFDVEIGEGDAGWPATMEALDACGYSKSAIGNWATAEVRGGDAKRLTEVRKQMAHVLSM